GTCAAPLRSVWDDGQGSVVMRVAVVVLLRGNTMRKGTAVPVIKELTESKFQQMVLGLARLHRWEWFHVYDSRRSPAGFPDLVLVRERVVFAELKTDTGRLHWQQRLWQEWLKKAGAEVYIWRPKDWQTIQDILA